MFFYAILFLFFFQLIAAFIEAIYAFGLMGTGIPPEIVCVLLLFSPLLLLIPKQGLGKRGVVGLSGLVIACRLLYPLLDTREQMLVAGVGVAFFLLLLPAFFDNLAGASSAQTALNLGAGLTLGVVFSILLRALDFGSDTSTQGWTQAIGWVLATVAFLRLPKLPGESQSSSNKVSFGKLLLLVIGVVAGLTMLYFIFTAPQVMARWTGFSYLSILSLLLASITVFAFLLGRAGSWSWLSKPVLAAWNALFVLSLAATILPYQIRFPSEPAAYPLFEPALAGWSAIPLVVMLLLSPIVFLDFILCTRQILELRPSPRSLAGGFSFAGFFLLLMIFAQVFTTVYDYIPVVGPFFRDKFWLVHLVLAVVMALPAFWISSKSEKEHPLPRLFAVSVLVISALAMLSVSLTQAQPVPAADKSSLRILTYNIQQGYNDAGQLNYHGQLAAARNLDADIIGLQESDTNRIANGNRDLVRYFADQLDMYSYFGPKTVSGTFGIALLSRYPIQNPRTFYMYSEGEQTATIQANITVGGKTFNVFVTHLGNGGPIIQQEAILQVVNGLSDVILVGDFNFKPDGEQYQLTRQTLADAWLMRWSDGMDDQGINPSERIDHIFLSPATMVNEVRYIFSQASDHPALWAEIVW